jgi:hypothetical protein
MTKLQRTWPLPALLVWALGWAVFAALRAAHAPLVVAITAAIALGASLSVLGETPWRRVFVAAGVPLSIAASGAAGALPAWGWLMPLGLLALVYPVGTWRDAPMFPTPAGALRGLAAAVPLPSNAHVLDAGCGLGDGLRELHREYAGADLHGIESSWPLRWMCGRRCAFARVRRGDIWFADWSAFDLVYVFQRPETIDRAVTKAMLEMPPGAWLASLEFAAASFTPTKTVPCADGRTLWLYRMPPRADRALPSAPTLRRPTP